MDSVLKINNALMQMYTVYITSLFINILAKRTCDI